MLVKPGHVLIVWTNPLYLRECTLAKRRLPLLGHKKVPLFLSLTFLEL